MSTSRRGKNEGSITLRKDGRWHGRVDLGRDEHGKRQRKNVYGATRKEVAQELNKLLGRAVTGELLATSTPTLAAWLETWYAANQHKWRGTTPRVYRQAVDEWIVPMLGHVRLDALKPAMVQTWISAHTKTGGRAYVLIAHTVLRSALRFAMRQRQVTYNAAELVEIPRPEKKPIVPLTTEEANRLIGVAGRHRLGALVIEALALGLRMGEVCGQTWPLVNLEAGEVDIVQQLQPVRVKDAPKGQRQQLLLVPLKTRASRRRLTLPAVAVKALRQHRRRQQEERLRAGAAWTNPHDLVFTTRQGRPLDQNQVRRAFKAMLSEAKIDHRKFHTVRHTAATLLLGAGAQLADISKSLGHAGIQITSDTYTHFVPEVAAAVASRMDTILPATAEKKR